MGLRSGAALKGKSYIPLGLWPAGRAGTVRWWDQLQLLTSDSRGIGVQRFSQFHIYGGEDRYVARLRRTAAGGWWTISKAACLFHEISKFHKHVACGKCYDSARLERNEQDIWVSF